MAIPRQTIHPSTPLDPIATDPAGTPVTGSARPPSGEHDDFSDDDDAPLQAAAYDGNALMAQSAAQQEALARALDEEDAGACDPGSEGAVTPDLQAGDVEEDAFAAAPEAPPAMAAGSTRVLTPQQKAEDGERRSRFVHEALRHRSARTAANPDALGPAQRMDGSPRHGLRDAADWTRRHFAAADRAQDAMLTAATVAICLALAANDHLARTQPPQ